jgi:hypothetical protein
MTILPDNMIDYLHTLTPEVRKAMLNYLAQLEDHEAFPEAATREKETGEAEDVKGDFLFAVIDQRHIQTRPAIKWYNPFTTLGDRTGSSKRTKKKGLCFHHSAVPGGVGARTSVLETYRKQHDPTSQLDPVQIIVMWGKPAVDSPAVWRKLSQPISGEQWARAMAVAGRMRGEGPKDRYNAGLPYQVIRCANSVLVLNFDFEWVTWHGDGSNTDFIGWAWDAHSGKEHIDDAEDLIADVVYTVELARSEGHPIREFTCHCAWTIKPRDPDAEFIREVMIPAAERTNCIIDYDFKDAKNYRSIGEVLKAA